MLDKSQLETHRTWQEATGIGLGVVASLSPWLTGQIDDQSIMAATAAAGILVMLVSAMQLMVLNRAEEVLVLLSGLWLTLAPVGLGYVATPLGLLHLVIGPAIVALATLELWQDWELSDTELARYGN